MNEKVDSPLSAFKPTLFPGAVAHWPALRLWAGPSGIQRLIQLAGEVPVEIMVSSALAKNFRGDMQSLVLLQEKFSNFLNGSLLSFDLNGNSSSFEKTSDLIPSAMQFYLAQCPISSSDSASGHHRVPGPLSSLQHDFDIPFSLLESLNLLPPNSTNFVDHTNTTTNALSQINFWANIHSPVTSSLHYDPYQNLLCVVTGQKIVRLLPPSATKHLHGVAPVYHESANHADDDLFNPIRREELSRTITVSNSQLLEFILNPGDALFLPEGWWHQVSSTAGTMAVNFWWESTHSFDNTSIETDSINKLMANYYLRRRVQELTQKRKHEMLEEACIHAFKQNPVKLYHKTEPGMHTYLENLNLDTPLTPSEYEYIQQLKNLLPAVVGDRSPERKSIEVIDRKILALLHRGALPFMRILRGLKKEYPGVITVLLTEVDSTKFWEALTTGLEQRIADETDLNSSGGSRNSSNSNESNWVEKASGMDRVLSDFYDDLYSDKGCDRRIITARMLKFKEEFAREAYNSISLSSTF